MQINNAMNVVDKLEKSDLKGIIDFYDGYKHLYDVSKPDFYNLDREVEKKKNFFEKNLKFLIENDL